MNIYIYIYISYFICTSQHPYNRSALRSLWVGFLCAHSSYVHYVHVISLNNYIGI